jgi:membrane protein implicated in regulation of membrane protease activity
MFVVNDVLDALLLGFFFFGLVFSAISLFVGVADIGVDLDHSGHDAAAPGHHAHDALAPINVSTILAFLTWFGGVAYLARNGFDWLTGFSLVFGVMAGLAGGWIVFQVLRRLRATEGTLDPAENRVEGTVARVTSSIRAGGVGEIVYKIGGRQQIAAARAIDGVAIPRDTEVVIVDRSGGFALVQSWESFLGEEHADLASFATPSTKRPPPSLGT